MKFAVAGVINTAFGLAIYPLLLWINPWLRTHYMIGLVIAQAISLVFAFCVYKRAVFAARGNVLREFGTFSSFYLINYAINWVALPLLVEGGGFNPVYAQLMFAVVLIIGSYFWHSRLTFRQSESADG